MECILPKYRLSDDEYKRLWGNCIFVLDTSVLFNIYRYSPTLRNEAIVILSKISEKLWIPYQVAFEYYDNRFTVISEEINKYKSLEDIASNFLKLCKGEIDKDLRRKHTAASEILAGLEKDLTDQEQNFNKNLKKIAERLKENMRNFPTRADLEAIDKTISSLLNGRIGDPPSIEELIQICEKGSKRYDLRIPPGYRDEEEKKGEGLKKYGDLLLWFQIMNFAKEMKKPIIFVCDDLKDDWWWKPSDTTLGPRPELIQEFVSETKELFWMYSLDRFMKCAHKYIDLEVKEDVIEEAKEYRVEEEKRIKDIEFWAKFAREFSSVDPDVLRSFAKASTIDPDVLRSFAKASTIDPDVLRGFAKALTIDPDVLRGFAKASTIDPDVLRGFAKASTIDPDVLRGFAKALTIDPDVLRSFAKASTIDPDVLRSFAKASTFKPKVSESIAGARKSESSVNRKESKKEKD